MFKYTFTSTGYVDLEWIDDAIHDFVSLSKIHNTRVEGTVSTNYTYNNSNPTDLMHALVAKFDGLKNVHDIDWKVYPDDRIVVHVKSDDRQQADIVARYLARCIVMSMDSPTSSVRIDCDDNVTMTALRNVWFRGMEHPTVDTLMLLYTEM